MNLKNGAREGLNGQGKKTCKYITKSTKATQNRA